MGDKTEKPTPYRIKKAREKGEIAVSSELTGALLLLFLLLIFWGQSEKIVEGAMALFGGAFTALNNPQPLEASLYFCKEGIQFWMFILAAIALAALFLPLLQTAGKIKRKRQRGKKEGRSLFFAGKLMALFAVGSGYFYLTFPKLQHLFYLGWASSGQKVTFLMRHLFALSIWLVGASLLIGAADFFFLRWKAYQRLHLTKQELKEELREREGDRETKARMRER